MRRFFKSAVDNVKLFLAYTKLHNFGAVIIVLNDILNHVLGVLLLL